MYRRKAASANSKVNYSDPSVDKITVKEAINKQGDTQFAGN